MKLHAIKRIVVALVIIGLVAVISQLLGVEFKDKWGQLLMPLFAYVLYELLDGRFVKERDEYIYDLGYALVAFWASAYFFKGLFEDSGVGNGTVTILVLMAEYLTALIITPRIVTLPSHSAIQNEKFLRALKAKREYIKYSRKVAIDLMYYLIANGDEDSAKAQAKVVENFDDELEKVEASISSAKAEKEKGNFFNISKAIQDLIDKRLL